MKNCTKIRGITWFRTYRHKSLEEKQDWMGCTPQCTTKYREIRTRR